MFDIIIAIRIGVIQLIVNAIIFSDKVDVSLRPGQSQKDKAFIVMAELFLMQHTCHWFCRSRMVASARLMAQHKSPYAQVLRSVAPATREAYRAVVGG